jgi:hypothetical protein
MNQEQPVVVFAVAILSILCGTLGLVLLCFGTIAVPASIYAADQINFLGQENPQTALYAGAAGLVIGIILIAIAVFVILSIMGRRDDRDVIREYEPYQEL